MSEGNLDGQVKDWISKVEAMKNGEVDLSRDEDLSIALMNLISLEEHFYFTAMKTENQSYLEYMKSTRELRKKLLQKIVVNPVGEEWCISKHLLAASMRLYEVGCKDLSKNDLREANQCFKAGFDLWSLFFAINLKMIEMKQLSKNSVSEEDKKISRFSAIIKKIVDCCKEW